MAYSLTHSLTHSLTYSLTYSLTHSLTHSYSNKRYSLSESQVFVLDSLENQRKIGKGEEVYAVYPDTTAFYPATVVQGSYSLTYSLTHLLTYLITHSHTYSLTHRFKKEYQRRGADYNSSVFGGCRCLRQHAVQSHQREIRHSTIYVNVKLL